MTRSIGISAKRRLFLRQAITSAPTAAVVVGNLGGVATAAAQSATPAAAFQPQFFKEPTWRLLQTLVDVLIPPGEEGPGGVEAGVAEFIDQQMDTPYGRGELWYMEGPHDPHAPATMGYQLPLAPRDLYAKALPAFDAAVTKTYGKAFVDLDDAGRQTAVAALEKGSLVIADDIPAEVFFTQLLQNVREGYFCDPVHGGNKQMAAWKMVGFPGARGDYYDWVDQYGKRYPLPPVSVG